MAHTHTDGPCKCDIKDPDPLVGKPTGRSFVITNEDDIVCDESPLVGKWLDYKVDFTTTSPKDTLVLRDKDGTITSDMTIATLGEWNDYFQLTQIHSWTKKSWVPFWLWKLMADPVDWTKPDGE